MCRGSTDDWRALHTVTCPALLLPFAAISAEPMKNEASLSIKDTYTKDAVWNNWPGIFCTMPLTIIKVALDFYFFFERERRVKRWRSEQTQKLNYFLICTQLVQDRNGQQWCWRNLWWFCFQVWLVNRECFTPDEEHNFNFQATTSGSCNGGKKELGFPGHMSRSGLPFLNHGLPFPKRRECKW